MSTLSVARDTTFEKMIALLKHQQDSKLDVIVPSTGLRSRNGSIEIRGMRPIAVDPVITDDGVTSHLDPDGRYRPTGAANATIADKLGIDRRYLRRLHTERPDLYDANINGLLHGQSLIHAGVTEQIYPADDRSFLLRLFGNPRGGEGVMRALLSDRYQIIDNLDVLTAVMTGIKRADVDVQIRSCDVTESSMRVKVFSPAVRALAPRFLDGYRDPFANSALENARLRVRRWRQVAAGEGQHYRAGAEPVVFAGFRFSNDETGHSRVSLQPQMFIKVCRNGYTLPMFEGIGKVHLGVKMGTGVRWSDQTRRKVLDLITAQAADSVRSWLSPQFLAEQLTEIERLAGAPVTQAATAVTVVGKKLGFTEDERSGVLEHFIAGGQPTAAGVAQAVTSYSQTVPDADRADALESLAFDAMRLAA